MFFRHQKRRHTLTVRPTTTIDFVIEPAENPSPFVLVEIDFGSTSECRRGGDHLIANPIVLAKPVMDFSMPYWFIHFACFFSLGAEI